MTPEYLLILNGPNLNALGRREPDIYGRKDFDSYLAELRQCYPQTKILYYQSNHEGALIDKLYEAESNPGCLGIVLNAGAYTHTSLALADAIRSIVLPVIEVHISNTAAREEIRQCSLIASACKGTITGLGLESYTLAVHYFLHLYLNKEQIHETN
ncbi:3-dehydroquinate dehydratase [Porphyromonas crevioricanis]|uniref:3-dehydroquinate dehydratase n=1 Tax=Porphyromonas crevioricanis JCM 15906 TaxID=1305617 RepID=T1CR50_9PORP|nr:type II 3-dehydroquinate dehydratase [Porphyromonas crevioricanis]KGN88822.1 3-dehydroquinate dehydratase [Porphyromonas crevioricanis]GAD05558.1 3-dehydroquinate dehydratase II [Porphyromonas crevioricanis JCM 15906]SJZ71646.1 3-dehydroquinate dehydratase [Porphyromonas crevioricanis]